MGVLMEAGNANGRSRFVELNGCTMETSDKTVESLPLPPQRRSAASQSLSDSTRPPPKKKWIKEYMEEEPAAALVSGGSDSGPPCIALHAASASHVAAPYTTSHLLIHTQHSLHSTITTNHSPGTSGSTVGIAGGGVAGCGLRAGTREVHNKLEKNRRAHLKECFELLKKQLPAADDKKASNLAILGSANRYIQVLRRKERECEHEMERLAREKIAAQQRLAALKREVSLRTPAPMQPPASLSAQADNDNTVSNGSEDRRERDERVNGHVVGIPISITSPAGGGGGAGSLTTHAVVTPLTITSHQNGVSENGLSGGVSTLVHPAHLHLPLSQVVRGGVVVGGTALQLVAGGGGLRVLHHAHTLNNRGVRDVGRSTEAGVMAAVPTDNGSGSVVVTPLVVSQAQAQLLHAHSLTHKVVDTQMMNAQYVGGALVKPVVVVSTAPVPAPPPHASPRLPQLQSIASNSESSGCARDLV